MLSKVQFEILLGFLQVSPVGLQVHQLRGITVRHRGYVGALALAGGLA